VSGLDEFAIAERNGWQIQVAPGPSSAFRPASTSTSAPRCSVP
jgi:hypothetical protein